MTEDSTEAAVLRARHILDMKSQQAARDKEYADLKANTSREVLPNQVGFLKEFEGIKKEINALKAQHEKDFAAHKEQIASQIRGISFDVTTAKAAAKAAQDLANKNVQEIKRTNGKIEFAVNGLEAIMKCQTTPDRKSSFKRLRETLGVEEKQIDLLAPKSCLLYTSPSPRDGLLSRMPSSA